MLTGLLNVFRTIRAHELTKDHVFAAMRRFGQLQLASRILDEKILFPFVDQTRLFGKKGMTGANGNYYCGLLEFRDMAFVLHYLRQDDVFIDVGANVGAYSILASGVTKAKTIAFEPVPRTIRHLVDNVAINELQGLVEIRACCISDQAGLVRFTQSKDTMNRMVSDGDEEPNTIEVSASTLDLELADMPARLIKIDTEGFDAEVLAGARRTLQARLPAALIVEFGNQAGQRTEAEAVSFLRQIDFVQVEYDPFHRDICCASPGPRASNNIIFVRGLDDARARVKGAPRRKIGDWIEI